MKKYIYFLLLFVNLKLAIGQLLPTIGLNSMPSNTTAICAEPWYLGSFYTSGLPVGNTVPDFKLYNLNGDSLILSNELLAGKPILLIAGSLTCPIFRGKINTINQIVATYGTAIKVFIIYTIEAHPTDTSVYFGNVNVTTQNQNAGILFPQPTTYGARKQLVDTMSYWVSPNAPVFIDGPCNEWWNAFGPAPNNAYIINPNGVIVKKHGWLDKSPDKIFCDIDNVLAINSGSCVVSNAPGTFTLNVLNSYVNGNAGDLLYDFARVKNTESVNVTVSVKKTQKNHPVGWQTAFCADVCYSTAEDSISFVIPPYDSLLFSLDFYTDAIPDSGSVKVGFRNVNKPNNSFAVRFRANTLAAQIGIGEYKKNTSIFSIFPNPSHDMVKLVTKEKNFTVTFRDYTGKEVYSALNETAIRTSDLERGIYFVSVVSENGTFVSKLILH